MRKALRTQPFSHITFDCAFHDVINACARPRASDEGTWITSRMIDAYEQAHEHGFAHSIEVWGENDRLIGGLYGIEVGRIFCGESMFSRVSNASKYALAALFATQNNLVLLDCQNHTPHLESLGGQLVHRAFYEALLNRYAEPPPERKLDFSISVQPRELREFFMAKTQ